MIDVPVLDSRIELDWCKSGHDNFESVSSELGPTAMKYRYDEP